MVALGLGELDDVLEAETAGVIVRAGAADDPSSQMLERRGVGEAMVALLRGESRMIGSLMVGGHLDARTFDAARPPPLPDARDPHHGDPREQPHGALDRAADRAAGAADAPGVSRLAHRPRQPLALRPAHRPGACGAARRAPRASRSSSSTSTISRASTTRSGMPPAMRCSSRSRRAFARCLRRPDTAARLGGDEFALLIEGVDSASKPSMSRAACSRRSAARSPSPATSITVRASLGIAVADKLPTQTRRVSCAMPTWRCMSPRARDATATCSSRRAWRAKSCTGASCVASSSARWS